MITLTWSWFSFFVGIGATVTLTFWALFFIALANFRKQKREAKKVSSLLESWKSKG